MAENSSAVDVIASEAEEEAYVRGWEPLREKVMGGLTLNPESALHI